MAKKDDVYIGLIKFVKEKTAETGLMSQEEGLDFLRDNYPGLNELMLHYFFNDVTSMLQQDAMRSVPERYRLSSDAYFQLLEHTELEEARTSSQKALTVATWAIVISIIMAFIQVLVALVFD